MLGMVDRSAWIAFRPCSQFKTRKQAQRSAMFPCWPNNRDGFLKNQGREEKKSETAPLKSKKILEGLEN